MSENEMEVEAQVELLVQAGAVAPGDRGKAVRVLHARRNLADVRFAAGPNTLDEALSRLLEAIESIREQRARWAMLMDAVAPLAEDPRCREPFERLDAIFREFSAACDSLSMPGGASGAVFGRLQEQLIGAVETLRKIVGP